MYRLGFFLFLYKQKTAYELRISDWSSDVCSSDLIAANDGDNAYCTDESSTGITLTATITTPDLVATGLGVNYQWFISDDATGTDRQPVSGEIGRASCRERVCKYV